MRTKVPTAVRMQRTDAVLACLTVFSVYSLVSGRGSQKAGARKDARVVKNRKAAALVLA